MEDLISAVESHARKNYSEDGWDYIIEAWDREDIKAVLNQSQASTNEEAILAVALKINDLAEYRTDIEGTVF